MKRAILPSILIALSPLGAQAEMQCELHKLRHGPGVSKKFEIKDATVNLGAIEFHGKNYYFDIALMQEWTRVQVQRGSKRLMSMQIWNDGSDAKKLTFSFRDGREEIFVDCEK